VVSDGQGKEITKYLKPIVDFVFTGQCLVTKLFYQTLSLVVFERLCNTENGSL